MAGTPATAALDKAGVAFTQHEYAYDPSAERIGIAAAEAMGVPASAVLKTIMARVDERPVCVILPSDREIAMKELARGLAAKAARMMTVEEAERFTAYKVGGVSPLGQKGRAEVVLDAGVDDEAAVFVNGGRRGLQLRLRAGDLAGATAAKRIAVAR
ncbi:YbaK/EbsC family protein [Sphingomonas sp. ID0503]|uniref:YbaK/EbsC family protein n=1 Tax=Sphingomonas sp. ID0503 TaxID=3399691 RepID=UPI003AFA55C4